MERCDERQANPLPLFLSPPQRSLPPPAEMHAITRSSDNILEVDRRTVIVRVIDQVGRCVRMSLTPVDDIRLYGPRLEDASDVAGRTIVMTGANSVDISTGASVSSGIDALTPVHLPTFTSRVAAPVRFVDTPGAAGMPAEMTLNLVEQKGLMMLDELMPNTPRWFPGLWHWEQGCEIRRCSGGDGLYLHQRHYSGGLVATSTREIACPDPQLYVGTQQPQREDWDDYTYEVRGDRLIGKCHLASRPFEPGEQLVWLSSEKSDSLRPFVLVGSMEAATGRRRFIADVLFVVGLVVYCFAITLMAMSAIGRMWKRRSHWGVHDLSYNNQMLLVLGSSAISSALALSRLLQALRVQAGGPCSLRTDFSAEFELLRSAVLNRLDATYSSWSNALGYCTAATMMTAALFGMSAVNKTGRSASEVHVRGLHSSWPLGLIGMVTSSSLEAGLIKFFELGLNDGQLYVGSANGLFLALTVVILALVALQTALGVTILVLQDIDPGNVLALTLSPVIELKNVEYRRRLRGYGYGALAALSCGVVPRRLALGRWQLSESCTGLVHLQRAKHRDGDTGLGFVTSWPSNVDGKGQALRKLGQARGTLGSGRGAVGHVLGSAASVHIRRRVETCSDAEDVGRTGRENIKLVTSNIQERTRREPIVHAFARPEQFTVSVTQQIGAAGLPGPPLVRVIKDNWRRGSIAGSQVLYDRSLGSPDSVVVHRDVSMPLLPRAGGAAVDCPSAIGRFGHQWVGCPCMLALGRVQPISSIK
jgi:hypothetical protein